MSTKIGRCERANKLIHFISERGRKFFHGKDYTAFICINDLGRYYFFDDYSNQLIYMWNNRAWSRNFSHGGTLQALLISLKKYIQTGEDLKGIVPYRFSDDNIWGYPEVDVIQIEDYANQLGIVKNNKLIIEGAGDE